MSGQVLSRRVYGEMEERPRAGSNKALCASVAICALDMLCEKLPFRRRISHLLIHILRDIKVVVGAAVLELDFNTRLPSS
jgi:hypothetical protein